MGGAMLNLVVDNDKIEQEANPPFPIQPKTMGKGPTNWDWLSPMVVGTEFLCSHKQQSQWLLTNFTHGGKKEGAVLLIPTSTMNDNRSWIWVDPVEFCKVFEPRGVLDVPED